MKTYKIEINNIYNMNCLNELKLIKRKRLENDILHKFIIIYID